MPTTLPVLTRTIDNMFVTTWYEIRAEAVDNILDATVLWALLNETGRLTQQVGGEFITRTILHGEQAAVDIQKGDSLPQGDTELETMAIWTQKTIASHVQADLFDDQKNAGPSKIKDYVGQKLQAARDGLQQKFETNLLTAFQANETGKILQGFNDMIPPIGDRGAGTYGRITRADTFAADSNGNTVPTGGVNPWWGSIYRAGTEATLETDLLDDMRELYATVHANQSPPKVLITTQRLFGVYEDVAVTASQIIKDETTFLADLGFEVLRFKGKPIIWTPNMTTDHMLMINTDFVEVVYDPNFWFDMTDFKPIALETKRIAHIVSFANMISDQLRRHGRLEYS